MSPVRLDVVGLHPGGTSELDFDFWAWAMEQYDEAVADVRRPAASTRLLDDVQAAGPMPAPTCPTAPAVVIIGGGVIGTSVAYHLTQLGWTDVLLLEQGQLSCGTTWHAAGLVGQLRATESGTRLVQYSTELYARLEAETGLATGYKRAVG